MQFSKFILIVTVVLWITSACSSPPAESTGSAAAVSNQPIEVATAAETSTATAERDDDAETSERPAGWGEESHSNKADPNYDIVFPQDKVNEITITIDPEDWAAMQANMIELYGEPGTRGGRGGPGGGGPPGANFGQNNEPLPEDFQRPGNSNSEAEENGSPAGDPPPAGFAPPELAEGNPPGQAFGRSGGGGPGGFGGPGFGGGENPMWVPATLEFDGNIWTNVGVRYKGNSSLMSSWNSGSSNLPLKLDFDEFEDIYPEIDNQRFYGFKQLSLANDFGDSTYMNNAITYDLLEAAGLAASETGYYNITLDYGEGPVDLGLYTAVEVPDDTAIEHYFGDDKGNIYEGDGGGASLAEGTFDQIETSFQKENNEDEADWSDIENLYNVLHSPQRTTDPEAWRSDLEAVFDVNSFLKWLALSATIQHWDTYGGMSHNFYLYHNPATDQLTWFSWDHNQVLGGSGGPGGGGGGPRPMPVGDPSAQAEPSAEDGTTQTEPSPAEEANPRAEGRGRGGPGGGRSSSLDKADVGDNWPLIRYLLDDPTYYDLYMDYLAEINRDVFIPDQLAEKYQDLAELIGPYVAKEDGLESFENAVQSLTERTYERAEAVASFLSTR
ncbi:MAG: CotH kinase family protein [Anaerolineae bacterium]|nr:CotH kinase family protein [Anaerolineae bacterium]